MPVKKRINKRRVDYDPAAWAMLFECGSDYFRHLPFASEAEVREAARGAWEHLGAAFLTNRRESIQRAEPWALKQFGKPRHAG